MMQTTFARRPRRDIPRILIFVSLVTLLGCAGGEESGSDAANVLTWETVQDSADRVAAVSGLSGPEAVRYDPALDVYFVANFNGGGNERDANGFISRITADGAVEVLQYMTGTAEYPLHAPRGMYITADTLWVADADGVHGFMTTTGAHAAFVDFRAFEPGFLNDIASGPDGSLYITDTGRSRVYRIQDGEPSIAIEHPALGPPNGVTWDAVNGRMLLAPWGEGTTFTAWVPGQTTVDSISGPMPGEMDGIEIVNGHVLVASQTDRHIHRLADGERHPVISVPGDPADIGIDTRRNRVAVPYIALNRVDIWRLPGS